MTIWKLEEAGLCHTLFTASEYIYLQSSGLGCSYLDDHYLRITFKNIVTKKYICTCLFLLACDLTARLQTTLVLAQVIFVKAAREVSNNVQNSFANIQVLNGRGASLFAGDDQMAQI